MADLSSKPGNRATSKLLAVGYAFLVSLVIMLLSPVHNGIAFLSIQCLLLVFAIPVYLSTAPNADSWLKRTPELFLKLLRPAGFVLSGTAAAFLASFVTPLPLADIIMVSLFALTFGIFLAGVSCASRVLAGRTGSQALTLSVGLLMISTPYYINPFILAASGPLRMFIVQWAVNVNPLLVGAAGVLKYDWLRAPHLYQSCVIGGYQFPFYYPSPLKTGIIFSAAGIILIAIGALRKAGRSEISE